MHTLLMSKSILVKWALPIALVLALVASFTVVGASDGGEVGLGSDDFGIADDFADFNPAYEYVLVGPAEDEEEEGGLPLVLYAIDVENQTSVVTLGGGDVMTVTLTNLIEEAIPNGAYSFNNGTVTVSGNGDIAGNIVITADMYAPDGYVETLTELLTAWGADPWGLGGNLTMVAKYLAGLVSGGSTGLQAVEATIGMLQDLPSATYSGTVTALQTNKTDVAADVNEAFRLARVTLGGAMSWTVVTTPLDIIEYGDLMGASPDYYLTCHPGKTVVVQIPIVPMCPVLTIFQYRAELDYGTAATPLV